MAELITKAALQDFLDKLKKGALAALNNKIKAQTDMKKVTVVAQKWYKVLELTPDTNTNQMCALVYIGGNNGGHTILSIGFNTKPSTPTTFIAQLSGTGTSNIKYRVRVYSGKGYLDVYTDSDTSLSIKLVDNYLNSGTLSILSKPEAVGDTGTLSRVFTPNTDGNAGAAWDV